MCVFVTPVLQETVVPGDSLASECVGKMVSSGLTEKSYLKR